MDLFEDPTDAAPTPGNAPEFSVSDISGAIKRMIEGEFANVRVRGEVGRVVIARTGHMYFDLKDDRNVLAAVSWKGQVGKLSHIPEEGMEVVATGRLTTFGPQSKYQLNVEDVTPAGAGALMAMLEKRRAVLAAEGLFDADRKRPLPYLPDVIGVVTSPTGAVIRDILHRLRDRFPRKVLVWPVAVQGKDCAAQVARAIAGFNAMTPGGVLPRPDLIIVARGGGSIEDLWGFNEEIVVRAAASSVIPLISAVGHETDTTLIDHAADRRAPTPTAAAEMAVPVRLDLMGWVDGQGARMTQIMAQAVTLRAQRLRDVSRGLPSQDRLLDTPRQRLDAVADRLPNALRAVVARRRVALSDVAGSVRPAVLSRLVTNERRALEVLGARLVPAMTRMVADARKSAAKDCDRLEALTARAQTAWQTQMARRADRLAGLDRLRETLGYTATLGRGYAVVRADGAVATTTADVRAARKVEVEFADGRVTLKDGPVQGTLF